MGHARLLSDSAIKPATRRGSNHPGDFHHTVRSYISKGDTSPKLKRVTRPPSTRPESKSLPSSSRHTKGAISRHFRGTLDGLVTVDTLIVPSWLSSTFVSLNKYNRLTKLDSKRR